MRASPLFISALLFAPAFAYAQTCDFPVCPSGYGYSLGGTDSSGPYGVCTYCDWWGFCAHELDHCPAGSTLNPKSGECTWNLCTGGCGGELPLCASTETYAGSGTDASGHVYGSCQTGPAYPGGPISNTLEYCRAGWTLQTASGQCFKNCLSDLVVSSVYLRDSSGTWISSVHLGQKYEICAIVKNIGTSWAGPSWVFQGGGLGVPVAPSITEGWVGPTGWVEACVSYSTTPSVGTWYVGVTADSTNAIAEYDEGNNSGTVVVKVVP